MHSPFLHLFQMPVPPHHGQEHAHYLGISLETIGPPMLKRILGPAINEHAAFATWSLICNGQRLQGRKLGLFRLLDDATGVIRASSSDNDHHAAVSIWD